MALESGPIPMSRTVRRIIQLALLTGQRRAEIAGFRKEEINLAGERPSLAIARGQLKTGTSTMFL